MPDSDIVVSALLAYTTAVLKGEGTSSSVIRSTEDALTSQVLLGMAAMPELKQAHSNLQVLKLVYHQISMDYEPASRLPIPDFGALASPHPPESAFIRLYSIFLIRHTVWSEENSQYVRVIQSLDQKYQECLKGVIESALEGLPEELEDTSFPDKGQDDGLREANLFYSAQKRSFEAEAKLTQALRKLEAVRGETTDKDKDTEERQDSSKRRVNPERKSLEGSNFTLGDSDSESDDDLKHTSHADSLESPSLGPDSVQRGTANERINELEIERLQADLNDKADELRQLEIQLDESRRTVQSHSNRIAQLESAVREVDHLRDEVEVHRHSAEKIRKSENVVDKLKKKLEAASGMRAEISDLQKQVKALTEENSEWDSKYTALIRSRTPNPVSREIAEDSIPETHASDLAARLQQLELVVHDKEAEIARLKTLICGANRKESDQTGISTSLGHDDGSPMKITEGEVESSPTSGHLLLSTSNHDSDTLSDSPPVSPETYNRLRRRILKLEALLAKASLPLESSAEAKSLRNAGQDLTREVDSKGPELGSSPTVDGEVLRQRVQEAIAETDMRYRTEKLLMLKAWTDLGQRAMKMGGGPDGAGTAQNGLAGPPFELSWANRARRQMHTVEPNRQ